MRLRGRNPQVASQREFQATPQADAVDHGHGWPGTVGEPCEESAARRAEPFDLLRRQVLERLEPIDVGSGEE